MTKFSFSCFFILSLVLGGCGKDSKKSTDAPANPGRLQWESIPSEFNPRVQDEKFSTADIQRIKMDIFDFKRDVEVVYSPDIPKDSGVLRLFSVFKDSASFGGLDVKAEEKNLHLKRYGTYQCAIKVVNGQITELKGGCYVRLQVFLPPGAEIEVYNVGTLISKRFIPVDVKTFLENIDQARQTEEKFTVIEEFLNSYNGTSKQPTLLAAELGQVIHKFNFAQEKFRALRRLHALVTDRDNLKTMIESEFSYFDREEARRIVGLPN